MTSVGRAFATRRTKDANAHCDPGGVHGWHQLRAVPLLSLPARLQRYRESKHRGRSLSCLVPCPLSGEEVNPTRRRATPARSQSFHSLFNAARMEEFMSKLHRSLLGAVLGAGLALGSGANAKDLTLCWAA